MTIDNSFLSDPMTNALYGEYSFDSSAFSNLNRTEYEMNNLASFRGAEEVLSFRSEYSIPFQSVLSQVYGTQEVILNTKSGIENFFLKKLFINPLIDIDLNEAHLRVWQEARKHLTGEENRSAPSYVCFDEYLFAERYQSTGSRRFISEFEEAISDSTFSYFFQIRKLLLYFLTEITYIRTSLLLDFGDEYENESQQKIALRFDTWAKMALHYTRRIAATILSQPGTLPDAEVDKISKKQAAQLQAFFAIRLNAVDEEINDILNFVKRDLSDNAEVFYKRYLSNALKMTGEVAESLDLDYYTTSMRRDMPIIANEVMLASNLLYSNFAAIHTDLIERFEMFIQKVDAALMLIHEKRRFSSYISQLAEKAVQKRKVLQTVQDDIYGPLFRSIFINTDRNNTYVSKHSSLDSLDEDSHPQYLLKSGGTITGDILIENNATIDGVTIKGHSHSGFDGTGKILSSSIDYQSARDSNLSNGSYVDKPLSISIDSFVSDIIDGGIPVFDMVISIEIDDESLINHEYEVIYTEIE